MVLWYGSARLGGHSLDKVNLTQREQASVILNYGHSKSASCINFAGRFSRREVSGDNEYIETLLERPQRPYRIRNRA